MSCHQVTFFLTPEDLAECERRVREIGPLTVFECRSDTQTPRTLSDTRVAEMGSTRLFIALARPEDMCSIRFSSAKAQNYFTLDILRSPAIELSRCFFHGNQLHRGRLYYTSRFYDGSSALVSKDAAFLSWAKLVLRSAVRGLKKDSQIQSYVGTQAARLREEGKCRFVED